MNLKKYAVINEHSRLISLTVEDVDNSYLKTLHQSQVNFSKKEVSKEETKKKKKRWAKVFFNSVCGFCPISCATHFL